MSFTKLYYHIVFSPKERRPVITSDIERDFYTLLYELMKKYNVFTYRIGGMPDHIHLLVELPAMASLSTFVQAIKRESSIEAAKLIPSWPGWQEGYSAFSCSYRELPMLKSYISRQKEHHKVVSFRDELRNWLIENGIPESTPFFPK